MGKIFRYEDEASMCTAFSLIAQNYGWTVYPETCGFDLVLLDPLSGIQIAVEAKQQFNAHVLEQIMEGEDRYWTPEGPDYKAVLVPVGGAKGLSSLARYLGVTLITAMYPCSTPGRNWTQVKDNPDQKYYSFSTYAFNNMIPDLSHKKGFLAYDFDTGKGWHDRWPSQRLNLPDYVPDVVAGASGPLKLTRWKIGAIKICILMEKRGYLVKQDFTDIRISMSRWTQIWMDKGDRRGIWVKGENFPDYRKEHETNFKQIEADFPKWGQDILMKNDVKQQELI